MRRRGRAALLTCAVLMAASGLSGVGASPASAALIHYWTFDQRADGFPTTADPARTVESADGWVDYETDGSAEVLVRLGDVPDEASAAVAHAAFGTLDDTGTCVTAWETSAPTWDPAADPAPAGPEVDLTGAFAFDGTTWDCGLVWLTSADGAETYDHVDGRKTGSVIADPARGRVRITKVAGTRVPVHRWQNIRVRLLYVGSQAADAVEVRGRGRDVRVRRTHIERPVESGRPVWVRLRVRLDVPHPREVMLHVLTHGSFAESDDRATVRLRPARH